MFSFFTKKRPTENTSKSAIITDMHSHLLPGVDDGAADMEESMKLIQTFADMGYQRLVTTPHVIDDFYKNTPEIILGKLAEVKAEIKKQGLDITIEAAAEYMVDEFFMSRIDNEKPILSFGEPRYVLIEVPFLNESVLLRNAIFKLKSAGYTPILAHPERYTYLCANFEKVEELFDTQVLFQINTVALCGYYNKPSQKLAEKLIEKGMVHFLSSDCHKMRHLDALRDTLKTKHYKKALDLPLLNYSI